MYLHDRFCSCHSRPGPLLFVCQGEPDFSVEFCVEVRLKTMKQAQVRRRREIIACICDIFLLPVCCVRNFSCFLPPLWQSSFSSVPWSSRPSPPSFHDWWGQKFLCRIFLALSSWRCHIPAAGGSHLRKQRPRAWICHILEAVWRYELQISKR